MLRENLGSVVAGTSVAPGPREVPSVAAGLNLQLTWASFALCSNYRREQGQSVWSDDCAEHEPIELTSTPWRAGAMSPQPACAAWVVAARRQTGIRIGLTCTKLHQQPIEQKDIHIRARCGASLRVRPTTLIFNAGTTTGELELEVLGLPSWRVGHVQETWTWEWHSPSDPDSLWRPMETGMLPVRLYFTAGAPINAAPRESFYYIACAAGAGATTAREAEDAVWRHFAAIHLGGRVRNARGQCLCFWRDVRLMNEDFNYVTRDAQALVVYGDSSCMGWADLMKESLAIHGIASRVRVILPAIDPACGLRVPRFTVPDGKGGQTTVSSACMLIRSYRWAERGGIENNRGLAPDDVIDTGGFNWRCNLPSDSRFINWDQVDVEDLGRPAHSQGEMLLSTGFLNHAVVRVDDDDDENGSRRYYDPSFGLGPFASLEEYETSLFARDSQTPGGFQVLVGYRPIYRQRGDGTRELIGVAGGFAGAAPAPPGHHLREEDPLVK